MMTITRTGVLYLSYDGLTDPLGQSQILPYLGGLSECAITIVSFEKEEKFEMGKGVVEAFCADHHLDWIPLVYHKRPPVVSTLYDIWRLRSVARRLHRKHDFRIVHCRSYITALVGLWMKRHYRLKFIFDMRGFWADERVEGGLWNLNNPLYRMIYSFFKRKERQFIQEADVVVSLTENARKEMLSWNLKAAVQVIPCCVDVGHFDPARITRDKQDALRQELGVKPGEFILLYLGSIGTWYEFPEMLNFFTQVKKLRPTARFLIVTPDRTNKSIPSREDLIVQSASRSRVPLFISLADASVIFIKPVFSKRASSATKMAEVLAMGVPVVTNAGWGDIDQYRGNLPGLITVLTPGEYPGAVAMLLQQQNAAEIRNSASNHFSLAKGIALYADVYQRLSRP